ncbi:hypothetical protein [Arthrobacter sp. PsM3]|uniref:hypothetical protein n=1 Tax=Arthrobacter sp. PsM3 TaxID=3030531 RepID=UPI00263A68F0|nr:hypothetical protein [Arthrobacter sp. PsM3]MDN4645097.1 hypothetical protein [Arthrobacter sp. PsM3]
MKRKTLVQSNNNRRLVSPVPGSGQQSLTSSKQSGWVSPVPGESSADRLRVQSTPMAAPAYGAQNPGE